MTKRRALAPLIALTFVVSTLAGSAFAATRAEWKAAAEGSLKVEQFALARRVEHRKPTDIGATFDANGERIYAFVRLLNKGTPQQLRVVWKREGRTYHGATVKVGRSPSWRTWAFITARSRLAGNWSVSIFGEDGKLLGAKAFTIVR